MNIENIVGEIAYELLDSYGIELTDLNEVRISDKKKLTEKIIVELKYGLEVDMECKKGDVENG